MREKGVVSVVIPTYNRARQCLVAVESVLRQTYPHIEVFVVDDGSTDDTEAVLADVDPRVTYIKQENGGVTVARNTGLKAANGEYVAFLDSDDQWMLWKLAAQMAVLEEFPEVGMVWSDLVAVDEQGKQIHTRYLRKMYHAYDLISIDEVFPDSSLAPTPVPGAPEELDSAAVYRGDIYKWMLLGSLVHTSTVLMRRERQNLTGLFDENLARTGEDYDFHFRTCSHGPVALLDIPTIYYQIGASDQLTAPELSRFMAKNNLRTIEKAWQQDHGRFDLPRHMIRNRWSSAWFWVGIEEFWEGTSNARHAFRNGLIWQPFNMKCLFYFMMTLVPHSWVLSMRSLKQSLSGQRQISAGENF